MMDLVRNLLGRKKVVAAGIAVVVAVAGRFGLELAVEDVALIVGPIVAFIIGQGIADNGKEAAKVAAAPKDGAS